MSSDKASNDPWVPLDASSASQGDAATGTLPASAFDFPEFKAPLPVDPLRQTIDSERYIQSLEKKLEKLKKARTKTKEPTSRDIITSLALFHDDQMRRFINTSAPVNGHVYESYEDSTPSLSAIQRRLHPERQPLNAEEVVELVKDDVVAKAVEELDISQSETLTMRNDVKETKTTSGEAASIRVDVECSKIEQSHRDSKRLCDEGGLQLQQSSDDKEEDSDKCVSNLADNAVEENWANFDHMNTKTE